MINRNNITDIREQIPFEIQKDTIFNIYTNHVTNYTHGFHKYPAKFIPQIPRWAIEKYVNREKGKLILDPFCGSGTTLVEGILEGHNVFGIDIDPLSVMITKVKTTPIDASKLEIICEWLIRSIKDNKRVGTFRPACANITHWFTDDAINKLSLIRNLINKVPEQFGNDRQTKDIFDLLIICLSSIIRRVSNADNESQKTYVSHTNVKKPEEVLTLFLAQLTYFRERIIEFSICANQNLKRDILCLSSEENLSAKLEGKTIDLVITSPPYIKAIDYIYNQMAELFWIGDLFGMETQTQQNEKKETYIGTKHLAKVRYSDYDPFKKTLDLDRIDHKIQEVYTNDSKNGHKHSFIAYKYFNSMERHFAEISNSLNDGVHYVMVIGDCSVSGIFFETAEFLAQLAERNGFRLTNNWGYNIKNRYMRFDRKGRGGKIEIDWVLDFAKSNSRE